MEFVCEFCNSTFSRKSNLTNHQKSAKFCLELQGKENQKFICKYCEKKLTSKNGLILHNKSCKNRFENNPEKLMEEIAELKEVNLSLQKDFELEISLLKKEMETIVTSKDKIIEDYKNKVEKLENHLMRLSERPTNTTNNTTNNNQRYQQMVQNLVPLKDEHYEQIRANLTEEHVKKGVQGYADLTYIVMKDKIICTDFSRRMLTYKDENGNIIVDPKMNEFTKKVFTEIQPKNDEIFEDCFNKLAKRFDKTTKELYIDKETMDENDQLIFERETDKLLEEKKELVYIKNDIDEIIKGKDNLLKSKYIEKVCQKTYRK
jgi:hypothetical protein